MLLKEKSEIIAPESSKKEFEKEDEKAEESLHQTTDTYKIYNYLKKEPSVLIAVISFVIAAGTALLNLVAYIRDKKFLSYWDVDSSFVYTDTNQVYIICAMALLSIVTFVTFTLLQRCIDTYIDSIKQLLLYDEIQKQQKRTLKSNKKICKDAKRELKKFNKRNLLVDEELRKKAEEISQKIRTCEKECTESEEGLVKLYRFTKRLRGHYKKLLKYELIGTFVLLFAIVSFCASIITNGVVWEILLVSFIVSALILVVYFVVAFCFAHSKYKKSKISDDARKYLSCEIKLEDLDNEYERKQSDIKKEFSEMLSDQTIKSICINIGVFVLFTLLSLSLFGNPADDMKNFLVYEHGGEEYVLIYKGEESLILEKTKFVNGYQIIDTRKQLFIEKNNVSMKRREFKNTKVIREESDFEELKKSTEKP